MAGFSLSLVLAVLSVPCGLAEESRGFGSARAGFSLSVGTSVLPVGTPVVEGRPVWCGGRVCSYEARAQRRAGGDWQAGQRPQYTTSASWISKPASSDAVRQGAPPVAQSTSLTAPQERHTKWWWLSPTRAS
jgi:hypothetical protein